MEIDITHMVEDADEMPMLSGSQAELGDNAGSLTWKNSCAYGEEHPLLTTDEQRDAARKHFREYGAWTDEQIAAWSERELQGIICQDVAAAIREREAYDNDDAFTASSTTSGRIYRGDNGRWYFYLGI
jgi:hypothetical protein